MRIISLLPAATEILYALKCGNQIVSDNAVTTTVDSTKSSPEIDLVVFNSLKFGQNIYKIDHDRFTSLKPDLVITQKLCQVCAISPTDIQAAIYDCRPTPEILSLHPHSIQQILENIIEVGQAIGKKKQAKKYVESLLQRIQNVQSITKRIKYWPRVYCLEWLDPPYSAGHWVPEQVEIAGGSDILATKGTDSTRTLWKKIVEYNPEVLILMPCGLSIERAGQELHLLTKKPQWKKLAAVKNNNVYLVNGPAYFNCSGPRVVDGIELLATIFHPQRFNDLAKKFSTQDVEMIN